MRVLLINRNDFVDGGADRVFLNTYDLLTNSSKSAPSPVSGASAGEGVGGEVDQQPADRIFVVDTFTRKNVGIETATDPRTLSIWHKILSVKNYLYNRKVAAALERKIIAFSPDLAHIHLIFGTLSISVLRVLKKHKIPVVMTLHDYRLICPANAMLDRHGKVCERCQGKKYYNCLTHRCSEGNLFFSTVIMLEAYMRKYFIRPLKLVDHFIFVSQFAQDKHVAFVPAYSAKSSHLYNMTALDKEVKYVRGDYFLYYGRLSKEKGLLTLIKAAKIAGIRLVIAGKGPQEADLLATCNLQPATDNRQPTTDNSQPTTSNLSLIGFQSGPNLQALIAGSNFVIVPSEWNENNPMTIVEGFSMGKPVIGSNIGGIPELVSEKTGFLFEMGNVEALAAVLKTASGITDEAYFQLCRNCREFAEQNFDQQLHLQRLTSIYQQVLN